LHDDMAIPLILLAAAEGLSLAGGRAEAPRRASQLHACAASAPLPKERLVVVESSDRYRELLASGVKYGHMDVRGNSTSLSEGRIGGRVLHPVAAAMLARRAKGSRPGERSDGFKVALAIEGGGMRGCVAAGMVAAIHSLGLTDSIDAVYGSSAGSLIGAYLLSRHEPTYGCSIYYEELPKAGRSFIDLRNVLRSLGLGALRLTPSGVSDLIQRRLGSPVLNLDQLLAPTCARAIGAKGARAHPSRASRQRGGRAEEAASRRSPATESQGRMPTQASNHQPRSAYPRAVPARPHRHTTDTIAPASGPPPSCPRVRTQVEIVQKRKPLDFERLRSCQPHQPLRVVASALESETSVALGMREGAWTSLAELTQCMRASMLLPGICGPVVMLRNASGEMEPHVSAMRLAPRCASPRYAFGTAGLLVPLCFWHRWASRPAMLFAPLGFSSRYAFGTAGLLVPLCASSRHARRARLLPHQRATRTRRYRGCPRRRTRCSSNRSRTGWRCAKAPHTCWCCARGQTG
jgi:hypothetical protein